MPYIYSTASCVVAWLGEADYDSDDVFSFVNRDYHLFPDGDKSDSSGYANSPERVRQLANLGPKINHLLDRPYWNRTWVIQELLMANRQMIVCGGSKVEGDRLQRLAGLHSVIGFYGWTSLRLLSSKQGRQIQFQGLTDLIRLSQDTECADTRDKIYALLGLLNEKHTTSSLRADYSLSVTQLFFRVLRELQTPPDGKSSMGVLRVLGTLNLPLYTIVSQTSDIDLGFDLVHAELVETKPDYLSLPIFQESFRIILHWEKFLEDHTMNRVFAPKGMGSFVLVFRQKKKGWEYKGCALLMSQDETDGFLDFARRFLELFRSCTSGAKITIEKEALVNGMLIHYVKLPKLMSAAIEVYNHSFLQWQNDIEMREVTKRDGQHHNGAAAPKAQARGL